MIRIPGIAAAQMGPTQKAGTRAHTLGDRLAVAGCRLALCRQGRDKMFDFATHRQPGPITARAGVAGPADLPSAQERP